MYDLRTRSLTRVLSRNRLVFLKTVGKKLFWGLGIPALAFKFGYEFGSPEETIRKNWVRDVYHKPNDDPNQPVNLEAAATFNRVIMTLLQRVANDTVRPTWNADSFFKRFGTSR